MTHKRLSTGLVTNSAASVYDPTSGYNGLVKTINLHNTHTTNVVVTLYHLAKTGTPATANIFLKVTLIPDETFEYSVGHIFAVANADNIEAVADVTNVVNYFIFGAEEAV